MSAREKAVRSYLFGSRWSLFELEVLSHHFCSEAPFERSHAPGYPPVLETLRSHGLIQKHSHKVTAKGVHFIAAICRTPLPGEPEPSPRHSTGEAV